MNLGSTYFLMAIAFFYSCFYCIFTTFCSYLIPPKASRILLMFYDIFWLTVIPFSFIFLPRLFRSTLFSSIIWPSWSQKSIIAFFFLSLSSYLKAALISTPQLTNLVKAWINGAVSNHSGGLRFSSFLSFPFLGAFFVFFLGLLSWAAILSSMIFLAQSFQCPSFFM